MELDAAQQNILLFVVCTELCKLEKGMQNVGGKTCVKLFFGTLVKLSGASELKELEPVSTALIHFIQSIPCLLMSRDGPRAFARVAPRVSR